MKEKQTMHEGAWDMNEKTVEINGTIYDKTTGLPIRRTDKAPKTQRSHASSIHRTTQRSQTLNRRYVQRKAAETSHEPKTVAVTNRPRAEVKRSPMIQKYAKHPVTAAKPKATVKSTVKSNDIIAPAATHPLVQKAQDVRRMPATPSAQKVVKPSDVIKREAIQSALDSAPANNVKKQRPARRPKQHTTKHMFGRALSFASSGLALLLIAGYFTYVNMPNLSVRVAAVQAGVHAGYPSYRPTGYSVAGPISFDDGTVAMTFGNNGTNQGFTLTQTRSGWDSEAVYENYVASRVDGDNYTTTTSGGLTIYTWNGNAAWVNNGILYTIDGDAPLTPEQIQRLAASL